MLRIIYNPEGSFCLPDNKVIPYVKDEVLPLMLDDNNHTIYIGQQLVLDAIRMVVKTERVDVCNIELICIKDNVEYVIPMQQNGRLSNWKPFPEIQQQILFNLI